jgi:hypothetical protein
MLHGSNRNPPLLQFLESRIENGGAGTAGIPVYESVLHALMSRITALLFRLSLPAMLVGNCLLPGEYSAGTTSTDRQLLICGRLSG